MTTIPPFNYDRMLPWIVEDLRVITNQIRALRGQTKNRDAIDYELAKAKEMLLAPEVSQWLVAEFGTEDIEVIKSGITKEEDTMRNNTVPTLKISGWRVIANDTNRQEACANQGNDPITDATDEDILEDDNLPVPVEELAGRPAEHIATLHGIEERIKLRLRRSAEDVIEIGRDLVTAKELLPHGTFLPWISTRFEMTDRTSQRFMNVFETYGDRFYNGSKSDNVSDLPPAVLYALAAPSTPSDVREEVETRVSAGEVITVAEVERLKREEREKGRREGKEEGQREAATENAAERAHLDVKMEEIKRDAHFFKTRAKELRNTADEYYDQIKEANASIEQLENEVKKATEARDSARTNAGAEARAKAKAKALADEALAARQQEMDGLERQARAATQAADQAAQEEKTLRKQIDDHTATLDRMRDAAHEMAQQTETVTALSETLFKGMNALHGFTLPPTPEVTPKWKTTSQMCRQMAEAIERHMVADQTATTQGN